MEKAEADKIIGGYVKKLYGFALSRLHKIDEAEELSSRTVCEVYKSLLIRDEIANLDGYVFRIAKNMYARYIDGKMKSIAADRAERLPDLSDPEQEFCDEEEYGLLRREIAYLSRTQRSVILQYYFHNLKIREIAEKLMIPESTVKWHLSASRKELKTGMEKTRTIGKLGVEPIRFINMGHSGSPGSKGDTADFLAKSLTQNIAYAAYHQPRTVSEIADELGVNPIFIEDEVKVLEEYGFMDRMSGDRYRTHIHIFEPNREGDKIRADAYNKYVPLFAEKFFAPVLKSITEIPDFVHVPDNDLNAYKWSLVCFLVHKLATAEIDNEKYEVERPDGGKYVANATVQRSFFEKSNEKKEQFWACGDMWRNMYSTEQEQRNWNSWQFDCYWSPRPGGWRDNLTSDYEKLDYFLRGELPETDSNLESYQRLLEKGYIVKENGSYRCNVILCDSLEKWFQHIPNASEEITALSKEYAEKVTEADLINQPKHMHEEIRYYQQNAAASLRTRIMFELVDMGVLKKPKKEQAKTLLTIFFSGK
ncbi:MAG: sigma-70 family RNA polymerase sigma factor [Bacteroides sp.]|nr:sigma-70 family RNA polymerase sigma factor [Eubacterium sp.]MCM1417290.1 sigma-70 family RNA polymerase sigma factor [Roseburia sp.]MCM1461090.1 sigma-70 family RNA polymerase sigma factor [Bacteroides sp.]